MFPTLNNNPQRMLVALVFDNGQKMMASIKLPNSGKLADALNGPEHFLDLITAEGQQIFKAKSTIHQVAPADAPPAKLNQQRRTSDRAPFNPYAVLGVDKNTPGEQLRAAYVALAKAYHPDRFASLDLPAEMKEYASAMQARINLAYQQLTA